MRRLLAEVLDRMDGVQPVPAVPELALLALLALLLVGPRSLWRRTRLLHTVVHEFGHAVAAVLTGRRLSGIRLHSDTSGLTLSRGRSRGAGMVATLAAGYPAAAVFGLGTAAFLGTGRAVAFLWLVLGLLLLMLLQIRNLYGAVAVLVIGGLLALATWWLPEQYLVWLAHLIAFVLLLGAPRPVLELIGSGRHPSSDAGQLARITRTPERLWQLAFLLVTSAAAVTGLGLLLPLREWVAAWWG